MLNENHEQTSNANFGFVIYHDIYERLELLPPEQPNILDNLSKESDFELDDYFMELELNCDE